MGSPASPLPTAPGGRSFTASRSIFAASNIMAPLPAGETAFRGSAMATEPDPGGVRPARPTTSARPRAPDGQARRRAPGSVVACNIPDLRGAQGAEWPRYLPRTGGWPFIGVPRRQGIRPIRPAPGRGGGLAYCDCTFPYFLSRLSGIPDIATRFIWCWYSLQSAGRGSPSGHARGGRGTFPALCLACVFCRRGDST